MAEWTNLPDQEPGDPSLATWANSVRDNPIAIAQGAAGAPKVTEAAMLANSIHGNRIRTSTLTATQLANGAGEVNWVLARTAGAAYGAVGTYALLRKNTGTPADPNSTWAGSSLVPAPTSGVSEGFGSPAGTWRCMGVAQAFTQPAADRTTVWLRIS